MVTGIGTNYSSIVMLVFIILIGFVGFHFLGSFSSNAGFAGSGSILPLSCPLMVDGKCDGAVYGDTKPTVESAFTDAQTACVAKEKSCKQAEDDEEKGNNTRCLNAACAYDKKSKLVPPCFWASCSLTDSSGKKIKYRPDQFKLNAGGIPIEPNATGSTSGVGSPNAVVGWKCEFYFQYNYFNYTCELPPPNKSRQ